MACKGFDEQVVRLDKEIADLANKFVLVRITNMRGVDLNRFDFDYDLTWAALFMNARGATYCRYGGRDSTEAEAHLTLLGLKASMNDALRFYDRDPNRAGPTAAPQRVEDYRAADRFKNEKCIHCHQVNEVRRETLRSAGQWRKEMAFAYPNPGNIGITVDKELGNWVRKVSPGSPAARAGIKEYDMIMSVGGKPVLSFLDFQYALHDLPESGEVEVRWLSSLRKVDSFAVDNRKRITLPPGWRTADISWRASMWGLSPTAAVYGQDLKPNEKKALGIPTDAVAFYMGDYVPPPAQRAGIHAKDIILGIDGHDLRMTMLQFNAWVRLNLNVGDRVVYNITRDGKRMRIPMTLAERD